AMAGDHTPPAAGGAKRPGRGIVRPPPAPGGPTRLSSSHPPLRGVSEIRRFFRTSETPVYFVSATAFNLLGIDRWVRGFRFVNYFDSFDGHHPHVFVPGE